MRQVAFGQHDQELLAAVAATQSTWLRNWPSSSAPNSRSTASPAAWPWVSLISLKWSMSAK
jgi:hypothetical protein